MKNIICENASPNLSNNRVVKFQHKIKTVKSARKVPKIENAGKKELEYIIAIAKLENEKCLFDHIKEVGNGKFDRVLILFTLFKA